VLAAAPAAVAAVTGERREQDRLGAAGVRAAASCGSGCFLLLLRGSAATLLSVWQ